MTKELDLNLIIVLIGTAAIGFAIAFVLFKGKDTSANLKNVSSNEKIADVSVGLKKEQAQTANSSSSNDEKVLSPSQFRSFKVLKVTKISHNTKLIRFEIHPEKTLGLTIGRHITLRAEIDGNKVMRAYTPTSKIDQKGFFDLLVKCYEFGKMSSYLNQVKVGQSVEVRGPVGRFQYQVNQYPLIGLIAAGTGITPCLQVIRSILFCPSYAEDTTKFILFYQNRTEEDILLVEELQELQKKFSHRLEIFYFLSNPNTTATSENFGNKGNKYELRGYIGQELLKEYMSVDQCPLVCLCGPSGFNDFIKELLLKLGHDKSVFVW